MTNSIKNNISDYIIQIKNHIDILDDCFYFDNPDEHFLLIVSLIEQDSSDFIKNYFQDLNYNIAS